MHLIVHWIIVDCIIRLGLSSGELVWSIIVQFTFRLGC